MSEASADGRVLVVDDSLSVRRAIERMLAPKGLTVTGATDGSEALERLAAERPDLVICDVMLPEVDGYEVCRFVRRRPALTGVPVLLISGVSSPEVEERAAAVGATGVLAKPFTAESLLARIEGLVGTGAEAGPAAPPRPDDGPADPALEEALAAARRMPGFRAAWVLDPEGGGGRDAAGEPPPPGLLAAVRHAVAATGELGLGSPYELFIEGAEGTLVVDPIGPEGPVAGSVLAVQFDRSIRLGLARHLVRRLLRRPESLTPIPEGDRNGDRPR